MPHQLSQRGRTLRLIRLIRLILIFLAVAGTQAPAFAQSVTFQATGDNETGWNPFGSYNDNGFDWIDLANGAVNLKVTFASMSTRGHTSRFSYDYSSKMWSVYPIQQQTHYIANWQVENGAGSVPGPAAGWMLSDTAGSAVKVTHIINTLQCFSAGKMVTWKYLGNYVGTDSNGAKHNFPNWKWNSGPPPQGMTCDIPTTQYLTGYASDNSGAYLDISTGTGKISYPSGDFSISANASSFTDANANTWNQYTSANGQTFVQTTLGPGGALSSVQVLDASGAWQTYSMTPGQVTTTATFPNPYNGGINGRIINTLTQISMPNSQSYQFQYQGTAGELTKVILPTGGYIRYEYTTIPTSMYASGWATFVPADGRWVTKRAVSPDGTAGSEQVWTYAYSRTDPSNPSSPLTTTVTKPDGSYEIHQFTRTLASPYHEISVEYHSTGGALLKRVANTWTSDIVPTISEFEETPLYDSGNFRITNTSTTLDDGQQSAVNLYYDTLSYTDIYNTAVNTTRGNIKKKEETAFGPTSPGPIIRVTKIQYLYEQNPAYLTPYIISPVAAKWVGTPSNTLSLSEYAYDTTTPTGLHGNMSVSKAALLVAGAPNPDTPPDSSVSSWLSTTNSYDTYGNLSQAVGPAPKSYTTTFEHNQCNAGYLSATNFPVSGIRTEKTWNCNIGQVTQDKDANLQLTNYTYNDPRHRLTRVDFPDQGYETYVYSDSTRNVAATKNIQLSPPLQYVVNFDFDQLGRLSRKRLTSAPEGTITTDYTYDNLGRLVSTSNPYLTVADSTYGVTTTQYDATSRITKLIPPDGSATVDNVTTAYSGNCMTVADQAGKIRKSCSDALGRVIQAFEPDPSNALINETDYQYDVLDNVIRVDQKGNTTDSNQWRTRLFAYNSMSQLVQASSPEAGTTNYAYDNDGNLQSKSDARNITTTYTGYDGMHRLAGKSYSNGDPSISYSYDQPTCLGQPLCANVGRRTGMTDAAGSEAWSYDVMGRPLVDQRTTNGVTKNTISTHATGGFVYQLTYPSTRVVTYSYDAAARATSGIDTANSINYATGVTYSPAGLVASEQNGTSLSSVFYYNNRLQPCRISVRSSGTAASSCTNLTNMGNVLDLSYGFGVGVNDNGNVLTIANNRDTTRSQAFTYDPLDRLASAQTASTFATSPTHCWGETYQFDNQPTGGPWGNLTGITPMTGNYVGCMQETLSVSIGTNNRITTSGFGYDSAGNMTNGPTTSFTYAYNAEGQMKQESVFSTAGYIYDGDGKRVEKTAGGTAYKLYWYDASGNVLDETDQTGSTTNSSFNEYVFFQGKRIARRDYASNLFYYFVDNLGTSRAIVQSGQTTPCYDSDFYPFGGERTPIVNTCSQSYKFTGKERDVESGLDNFGARYNDSGLGRFMTPDPLLSSGRPDNPQSWNRYAYALNNPLNVDDPTGLYDLVNHCDKNNKQCNDDFKTHAKELRNGLATLKKQADAMHDGPEKQRLEASLKALGTEGDNNGVNVSFGPVSGGAGETSYFANSDNLTMTANVTLDPSKTPGESEYAVNAAHEGTHIEDEMTTLIGATNYMSMPGITPLSTSLPELSPFSTEYRGYQTSSYAAQALGSASLTVGANQIEIWNSSWTEADRQTARDRAITSHVTSMDTHHPETTPHNPWPDR